MYVNICTVLTVKKEGINELDVFFSGKRVDSCIIQMAYSSFAVCVQAPSIQSTNSPNRVGPSTIFQSNRCVMDQYFYQKILFNVYASSCNLAGKMTSIEFDSMVIVQLKKETTTFHSFCRQTLLLYEQHEFATTIS